MILCNDMSCIFHSMTHQWSPACERFIDRAPIGKPKSEYQYDHPFIEPTAHLKWIAMDFDGTLAQDVWSPGCPETLIGPPIKWNVDKAKKLAAQGFKIVIHTSRSWSAWEAIESWLNFYNVPFKTIVAGKLLAHRYIDDRAIDAAEESWSSKV